MRLRYTKKRGVDAVVAPSNLFPARSFSSGFSVLSPFSYNPRVFPSFLQRPPPQPTPISLFQETLRRTFAMLCLPHLGTFHRLFFFYSPKWIPLFFLSLFLQLFYSMFIKEVWVKCFIYIYMYNLFCFHIEKYVL